MKLIKFLLFALLGLLVLWAGLVLLGFVGTIIHIVFWLAILYVVGMIVWKLMGGGKSESEKLQQRSQIEMKHDMERLKEATEKLEEIKREQRRVKQ